MLNKSALIKNRTAIKCLLCDSLIISLHRHDFKYCSCGHCFIDGGADYTRVGFNPGGEDKLTYLVGDFIVEIGTGKVLSYFSRIE